MSQLSLASHRRGYSMMEILVGLAIIAALAGVAVPVYTGYVERTQRREAEIQIARIEMQLDRYRSEFGKLPLELIHAIDPIPIDPWGAPFEYLNLQSGDPLIIGLRRKDKNLVPINSDYDLYSKGPDGQSHPPLTAAHSRDDIIRANDGEFVGLAEDY